MGIGVCQSCAAVGKKYICKQHVACVAVCNLQAVTVISTERKLFHRDFSAFTVSLHTSAVVSVFVYERDAFDVYRLVGRGCKVH